MSAPSSIAFRGISKSYDGHRVIESLDLDVAAGEFLVLLGPSGCGKTTLLRLTGGLIFPDAGEIHMGDRQVQFRQPKERDAAMVFQSYALYPHLSVAENLAFPLKASRTPEAEASRRVAAVAERLSIEDHLGKRPEQLSGGQAQRVALGRAIVREPSVFLMDEPLSNLDAKLRLQLRVELKRLHRQLGITTLYVTHDQEEALTLGDSIAVMNAGRIEQRGTPEEIYHDPETLFVAKFVGSPEINAFPARLEREGGLTLVAAAISPGAIRLPVEQVDGQPLPAEELIVAVRPEAVLIGEAGQHPIAGHVDVVEMVGRELRVYVTTEAGTIVGIEPASARRRAPGDRVSLAFSTNGHHLYDASSGRVVRSLRPPKQEALHA
jgi:sn-glycerol 3-phosphate transport system ATP-binding protein